MPIVLSKEFSLPIDCVTRRMAILAMSGAGKSNAAVVMAEQMYDAGIPWVAIDPKGDWWGVRSARDGTGAGLPIPVFGGLHGDLPIYANSGKDIADLVVDQRLSCVLDVSEFPERQGMWQFLSDFGETLLRRNREALHLFLEEADEYLPQKPGEKGNLAKCLGIWQRVVKRGRFRGIGTTQITQRSAAIHKDTLYQAELMIAMRVAGKGDRDAIHGWVEHHNASAEIIASLPGLDDGEAWISSPAWLKKTARIRFNRRRTFDSGSTPVLLHGKARPATLADIDLEMLRGKMAAVIEKAKAEDPRELKKKIAELEKELRQRTVAVVAKPPSGTEIQAAVTKALASQLKRFESVRNGFQTNGNSLERALVALGDAAQKLQFLVQQHHDLTASICAAIREEKAPPTQLDGPAKSSSIAIPVRPVKQPAVSRATSNGNGESAVGDTGLRRMLIALAQKNGQSAKQIGVRAGLSSSSGTFGTYLGKARTEGWIEGDRNKFSITEAGLSALGEYAPLPTGRDLLEYWLRELGDTGAGRMLLVLAEHGSEMTAEELGTAASISPSSGTFGTYLGKLRTLELVTGNRSALRASEDLS